MPVFKESARVRVCVCVYRETREKSLLPPFLSFLMFHFVDFLLTISHARVRVWVWVWGRAWAWVRGLGVAWGVGVGGRARGRAWGGAWAGGGRAQPWGD